MEKVLRFDRKRLKGCTAFLGGAFPFWGVHSLFGGVHSLFGGCIPFLGGVQTAKGVQSKQSYFLRHFLQRAVIDLAAGSHGQGVQDVDSYRVHMFWQLFLSHML